MVYAPLYLPFMSAHARKCCKLKIFLCLVKLFPDSFYLLYLIFKCFHVRLSLSVKSSIKCFDVCLKLLCKHMFCSPRLTVCSNILITNKLIRISDIRKQTSWYRDVVMQNIFKNAEECMYNYFG